MIIEIKEPMQQGVKYRGYGFINQYNEFQFVPEQTGSRKGKKKLVKEEENYSVYKTDKYVLFHIKVDRSKERNRLISLFLEVTNKIMQVLTRYEI